MYRCGARASICEEDLGSEAMQLAAIFGNPSLTWDDLDLRSHQTKLPILLKGLLHPNDAREAVRRSVDGIIVPITAAGS